MNDQMYLEDIREFQFRKEKELRAPDGWLTLAGLFWLKEGKNKIGSAYTSIVTLPANSAPQEVGEIVMEDGKVIFFPKNGVDARAQGKPIATPIELEADLDRNPTIITIDDLSFFVIIRGNRIGVRVKQVNHPRRLNFSGRVWWPVDEIFRVEANIEFYPSPKFVTVPDVLGDEKESRVDCALLFDMNGTSQRLEAFNLPDGQYYIIFHDQSCGNGSYAAGRFLVSETADLNTVVIDFNKAYNPPCAFTPYATCPLPPRENYLSIPIFAGERYLDEEKHQEER